MTPIAERHIDAIVKYINIDGKWTMPKFRYDSYCEIAERMIASNSPFEHKDGLLLMGLCQYAYGNPLDALDSIRQFVAIDSSNIEIVGIYLALLSAHAKIDEAIWAYEQYYIDNDLVNDLHHANAFAHLSLVMRLGFNPSRIATLFEIPNENHLINELYHTMQLETELIESANISPEIVREVVASAMSLLLSIGSYTVDSYQFRINEPNDDVYVDIMVRDIDDETMLELNDAWLDDIVSHQSTYSFSELSRVVVSFRAGEQ